MSRLEVFDKEKVIAKAIAAFWKKGYHDTSMQELVDATGLNRSSIYNSFGSKMDFFQLALRTYQKQRRAQLQNLLIKAGNPREALQLIFNDLVTQIIDNKANKGCFEINSITEMANHNNSIKQILLQSLEQQIDFFEHLIKDGQQRGLINERQTASDYAQFIYNAYQGMNITGILGKNKKTLQSVSVNVLRVLM